MVDISNVFFNTITRVSNLRYFNVQVVLDHRVEEQDINMNLQDDDEVLLEGTML